MKKKSHTNVRNIRSKFRKLHLAYPTLLDQIQSSVRVTILHAVILIITRSAHARTYSECKGLSFNHSEQVSFGPRQRERWLNTKKDITRSISTLIARFYDVTWADKRLCVWAENSRALDSTRASGEHHRLRFEPESPPLARTKACRREKKSFRLRAECNFSGIVNRYLYHSTPTRWRTILERSAYQLAWKLGLTLAYARYAFHDEAPWPRPYLLVAASTLCTTLHNQTAAFERGQKCATRAIGSIAFY